MSDLLHQLIERLLARTESGQLVWISLDSDYFRAAVGDGSVLVSESSQRVYPDPEPVPSIRLTVSDKFGQVVEQLDVPDSDEGYVRLERLYHAARRSARRGRDVLTEMLNSLTIS